MVEKSGVHDKIQESKQKCSNSCKQNISYSSSGSPTNRILYLQQTAGNQAVQRLIESRALQAKLKIGQSNDIYEKEADRVAEQVMRMPDPVLQSKKCTKCDEDEVRFLQTKNSSGQITLAQGHDVPPTVHEILRSPGQALDQATRAFMEPRFGHDFSRVRVHTDAAAEQSANDVNSHAYTVGQHIVFGVGKFAPWAHEGKRLIAHELTHVVQQSGTGGIHADQSNERINLSPISTNPTNPKLQRQPSVSAICHLVPSKDLSPREWRKCVDLGIIQEDNEYPLRFAVNSDRGVVATRDRLLAWKTRKGLTQELAIKYVMASHAFAGNDKARKEAATTLVPMMEKLNVCIRPVQIADDDGKKPTVLPSFDAAKAIWGKCCIDLSVKQPKTVSKTAFKTLDFGGSNTTQELKDLFFAAGEAGGCISLFVVEYFQQGNLKSKDIAGGAATYGTPGGDSIFAVEGLDPSIVAHELGHAMGLLGEWAHGLTGTVMEVTAGKHNQKESDKVIEVICDMVRKYNYSKPSGKKDCYLNLG